MSNVNSSPDRAEAFVSEKTPPIKGLVLKWQRLVRECLVEDRPTNHASIMAIVAVLVTHADPDGTNVYPSQETMALEAGLSRPTVKAALDYLLDRCLIEHVRKRAHGQDEYRLMLTESLQMQSELASESPSAGSDVKSDVKPDGKWFSTTSTPPHRSQQENRYEGTDSSGNGDSSQSGTRAPPKKTPPRENPRTPRQPEPYTWDELLSHFATEKRKGRGKHKVNVLCPTHDDDKPSLSIAKGDRAWMLRCHAGCDFNGITAAVGLDPARMFVEHRHMDGQPKPKPEEEPPPDEWSEYFQCHNCDGVVLGDEECCQSPDVAPVTVARVRELGLEKPKEGRDPPPEDPIPKPDLYDDSSFLQCNGCGSVFADDQEHGCDAGSRYLTVDELREHDERRERELEDCEDCDSELDRAIATVKDQGLLE